MKKLSKILLLSSVILSAPLAHAQSQVLMPSEEGVNIIACEAYLHTNFCKNPLNRNAGADPLTYANFYGWYKIVKRGVSFDQGKRYIIMEVRTKLENEKWSTPPEER